MQIINANIDEPQYYKNNLDKTQNATLAMKVSLKDAANLCTAHTICSLFIIPRCSERSQSEFWEKFCLKIYSHHKFDAKLEVNTSEISPENLFLGVCKNLEWIKTPDLIKNGMEMRVNISFE